MAPIANANSHRGVTSAREYKAIIKKPRNIDRDVDEHYLQVTLRVVTCKVAPRTLIAGNTNIYIYIYIHGTHWKC